MAGIASECCTFLFFCFFAGGSARKLGSVKWFSGQENTGPKYNSPASYAGDCLSPLLLFSTVSCLQMLSSESHEELETLLNMEMKLRLLDLENISIPGTPPPIPTDPPNFDFVYDFS